MIISYCSQLRVLNVFVESFIVPEVWLSSVTPGQVWEHIWLVGSLWTVVGSINWFSISFFEVTSLSAWGLSIRGVVHHRGFVFVLF